jgi:transcriptional regulator GlxA family with amidase domain
MTTFGLLIFDGAEELDFVGPWEVIAALRDAPGRDRRARRHMCDCRGERGPGPLRQGPARPSRPQLRRASAAGRARRTRRRRRPSRVTNTALTGWIRKTAADVSWVTSVCTGALLLHEAGPARGRRVATHHAHEGALAARGDVTVVRDARYVVDGNLVTSQGVSAGIDMALWLVGRIHGRQHARAVRRYIQYDPAPPYLADEPLT